MLYSICTGKLQMKARMYLHKAMNSSLRDTPSQSLFHTVSHLSSFAMNKKAFYKIKQKKWGWNDRWLYKRHRQSLINIQGSVRETQEPLIWIIVAKVHIWALTTAGSTQLLQRERVVTHWQKPDTYSVPSGEKMRLALLEIQPEPVWVSGAHTGRDPLDTAPTTGHEDARQHGHSGHICTTTTSASACEADRENKRLNETREDTYSWQAALQTASSAGHGWTSRKHRTVLERQETTPSRTNKHMHRRSLLGFAMAENVSSACFRAGQNHWITHLCQTFVLI